MKMFLRSIDIRFFEKTKSCMKIKQSGALPPAVEGCVATNIATQEFYGKQQRAVGLTFGHSKKVCVPGNLPLVLSIILVVSMSA